MLNLLHQVLNQALSQELGPRTQSRTCTNLECKLGAHCSETALSDAEIYKPVFWVSLSTKPHVFAATVMHKTKRRTRFETSAGFKRTTSGRRILEDGGCEVRSVFRYMQGPLRFWGDCPCVPETGMSYLRTRLVYSPNRLRATHT
jgi:hypothetical protein